MNATKLLKGFNKSSSLVRVPNTVVLPKRGKTPPTLSEASDHHADQQWKYDELASHHEKESGEPNLTAEERDSHTKAMGACKMAVHLHNEAGRHLYSYGVSSPKYAAARAETDKADSYADDVSQSTRPAAKATKLLKSFNGAVCKALSPTDFFGKYRHHNQQAAHHEVSASEARPAWLVKDDWTEHNLNKHAALAHRVAADANLAAHSHSITGPGASPDWKSEVKASHQRHSAFEHARNASDLADSASQLVEDHAKRKKQG